MGVLSMNKKTFLLTIYLMLSSITFAQSLKLGFRIEPTFLLTEAKTENSIAFSPYSFYFNIIVEPIDGLSLEVRPGYLIGGNEYSGFEFGAFARLKISSTKFFITSGLNNHSNNETGHNSGGSYAKEMLYKGIGIGFQKDSKLSFDIIYYWTDDKEFAYSFDGSSRKNKQMKGIIKLGFSLAWDVL